MRNTKKSLLINLLQINLVVVEPVDYDENDMKDYDRKNALSVENWVRMNYGCEVS